MKSYTYTMREIKDELKRRGLEIKKNSATLNGNAVYRVTGDDKNFNPSVLYTRSDIIGKLFY